MRNLLLAVMAGVFYSIISFIDNGYLKISTVLAAMALYFLSMCILCFIAPKLRKITGHDKNSNS